MTLFNLEQTYLYGGGCQMETEEEEITVCDCGHEEEIELTHLINNEKLCKKCFEKYRRDAIRKIESMFRGVFTEDDLNMIYEEDLISEVNL